MLINTIFILTKEYNNDLNSALILYKFNLSSLVSKLVLRYIQIYFYLIYIKSRGRSKIMFVEEV